MYDGVFYASAAPASPSPFLPPGIAAHSGLGSIFSIVFQFKLLLFNGFELVPEVELCSFFLELSKLILIFGYLLQSGFDKFASKIVYLNIEFVNLVISPSNLIL